jgi:hypothetical protein
MQILFLVLMRALYNFDCFVYFYFPYFSYSLFVSFMMFFGPIFLILSMRVWFDFASISFFALPTIFICPYSWLAMINSEKIENFKSFYFTRNLQIISFHNY